MLRKTSHTLQIVFFCAAALFLTGCDQIEKLTAGHKSNSKKIETVATQPQAASVAPLGANEVARVGSWRMTINEFNERLEALQEVIPDFDVTDAETKAQILEELIRQQLIVQDADQSGLSNEQDIKEAVEEFRRTLIVREVARQLTEKISVSDEEAKEFYETNKEVLVRQEEWRVREIMVEDQIKANEILVEALKGTDFADLARLHSKSATAANGGDLGFITEVPFAEMGTAIAALDVGGISAVFKGPDGYYIAKVDEKKGGEKVPFDEIKGDIVQSLTVQKQQQAVIEYIAALRERIEVDVNADLLKSE